ncbi:hypothetical protein EC968_001470 [Mortierella alpina]|nr:hypothetical protein EC968_001470 [Mortierella alpina]
MSKDEPRPPTHISWHQQPADAPAELATNPAQHRTAPQADIPAPAGEDPQTHGSTRNVALSSRIGSTGSQLVSQVNEVRKRTGRRVLHRPKPLDLDHARLHGHTSNQPEQPPQTSAASGPGSESNQPSAAPTSASGSGLGLLPTSPTQREPRHRPKFPILQIKTDLNRTSTSRRPTPVTGTATYPSDATNPANATNNTTYTFASNSDQQQQQPHQHQHPPERKAPSKWQLGLERMLKKIQRRKRAPSNLTWYAAHSTESYLSGATLDSRPGVSKPEIDTDADSLHYGSDKPPQWVVNSLQRDDLFFSDDTVELIVGLRDYIIKATDGGWDITELKEEIFSTEPKSVFHSRRHRSVSPHASPHKTSPVINTSAPTSPGGASQDSADSSRRNSRSSMDFDHFSQHAAGRYVEEEEGSYRLLDYFLAILSDVISHDCRYRVQHPRPSRPEWALHSLVLDVLFLLARALAHDHKAIYDIGMISLSAFPVFKNYALIRLLDLLTEMILPSFAASRTYPQATGAPASPIASLNPGSPRSPSQIRVQLDNNQTFAIQVHSPTEEMGMLSVPRTSRPTLNSPRIPSSRSSSTSLSRLGPQAPALDTMDTHADSLISLTLFSVLQQISFSKAPLPVAKQLQKSIGRLLRTKPDLSKDLLEVIAIVENEKVMKRALEALWWIEKPSLGHHTLGEKFIPLDYESILLMRQAQQERGEPGMTGIGLRAHTEKLETMFSFRKSLDENTSSRNDSAMRSNTLGSFMVRTKPPPGRSLPWKAASESEAIPMSNMQHQHQQSTHAPAGFDYLADHELYPYMFPTAETADSDSALVNICERCETAMKGFGLYCYHCRDSIHVECFYSIKKYAGMDCTQLGCSLDYVTRQPRSQLIYPDEGDVFESACNRTYMIRASHHLQLVNMFSTCLCACCELPLWGHHHQAYRCQDCEQLMHVECKGAVTNCPMNTQSEVPEKAFPTMITYDSLRRSFREFYQNLISTWEAIQASVPGSATLSSPGTPSSAHARDRYSFEEASCNASILTLQLELLQKGLARGEIQVSEWTQSGQATEPSTLTSSDFDLVTLHSYFVELVQVMLLPGSSTSPSLFLSDFFEDSKPDQLLLFSPAYWSHFASMTKTMITEAEASQWGISHQFFPPSREGTTLQEDAIFAIGLDEAQEKLLADHSVRASNVSLAAIFRFCMRRLGFKSVWSMQQVLQEWVKIGLLERLDGETCLFENAIQDQLSVPPPLLSPPGSGSLGSSPTGVPTLYTSSYDSTGQSGSTASYRSVHCLFPIVTAIDPTAEVENLIHAIWRCLSSVDLSVNESGFLLLTRRCWPDPFMSDYTAERLVGCIFHWLLLEDDQLFVIHKNYASKGKNIPGVRSGLEEQITRKRIVLGGDPHSGAVGGENATPGASSASAHTTNSTAAGSTTPAAAINNGTNANGRSSSTHSNLFGAVGSYVKTRKLMSKKFALPWLKHIMNQDPERYQEMVCRQIRILEREMASENEIDGPSQEDMQAFRHAQAERQLEFITKLRQAGFLFSTFSRVLSQWLAGVEEMLEGMDLRSKGFKTLNRLFLKPNSRTGSGLGGPTGNTNPVSSGYATPTSASLSKSGVLGENEWRSRLRSKLQHGSAIGSLRSQSPTSTESAPESVLDGMSASTMENLLQQTSQNEEGESPLSTLRMMLKDDTPARGVNKALHWLGLMVRSGVQVPTYVFLECCESLVALSQSPSPAPLGIQDTSYPSAKDGLEASSQAATKGVRATAPSLSPWENSMVLEQPRMFLKTCWESISTTVHRMSEAEAGRILDGVMTSNLAMIMKVMNQPTLTADTDGLECTRQLLKYALLITMYVYGCPTHIILKSEIMPSESQKSSSADTRGDGGFPPLQKQLHLRQQHQIAQPVTLDRSSATMDVLLKCLGSTTLSIQGEVVKGIAIIVEHAARVSNMDMFLDSIHEEFVPCLWDLLSPLHDHLADTTLPLLMRLVAGHPEYLHKIVACNFADQDWEVRFSALDSVFGLFSKLDDGLVLRLFFLPTTPTTVRPAGTMNGKGKGTERHRKQHRTGASSFLSDGNDRTTTDSSVHKEKNGHRTRTPNKYTDPAYFVTYAQFLPEHLQVLGPIFSYFVSSMWDKEDAVRTKAKALLKSLQPVHVSHALKAWELHFVASKPETQQTLLKLMTRLNNYFPSWKIMNYGLIFRVLTSGSLGRSVEAGSTVSLTDQSNVNAGGATASGSGGKMNAQPGALTNAATIHDTSPSVAIVKDSGASNQDQVPTTREELECGGDGSGLEEEEPSLQRRPSNSSSAILEAVPPMVAIMPAGEPSRHHRRESIISAAMSSTGSMEPGSGVAEAEERERQLALEDDVQCSLLNLALQMVANGIEPRLDEVIQLKYLVVFYLDFEGCELLSLGQGKFQVRYGEYIPRQRVSPIPGRTMGDVSDDENGPLNDPGHENFVLTICMNLQLILDRYIDIKPDSEKDTPTLYEQMQAREAKEYEGGGYEYEGMAMQSDHHTSSPSAGRTFSSTSEGTAEYGKASGHTSASGSQMGDDDDDDNDDDDGEDSRGHHRHQGLFCFPRHKHQQDEHHHQQAGDRSGQRSTTSQKNAYHYPQHQHGSQHGQVSSARYQQHSHQLYRRNPNRRYEENAPVVGTYFVDVILRFFGSETDLSVLPAGRLKSWLELLLIVVYKFIKEDDPLSDLVVVLMKRIIEMLMVRKSAPTSTNIAGTFTVPTGVSNGNMAVSASLVEEESMSEENTLLAISICSTLLKRSSTMTTALLSREIMAMGRLMTKRRDDPEDPVLIRAKTFLHDAFVHFMGNGLFVLVFKTQPAYNFNSFGWEESEPKADSDLDLFYVLGTVLGEDEMVPPEPITNNLNNSFGLSSTGAAPGSSTNARLVHIRDQPIRDIVDRVMIFRDLEPLQVSTILTNLALYVERVHSRFEDARLMPDMGQFLIKLTKYTAEWDQQQQQRQKELAQQLKQAQEQKQQQIQLQLLQQQHQQQALKKRGTQGHFPGNASTMFSNGSTVRLPPDPVQKQGVMSVNSGSTIATADNDPSGMMISPPETQIQSKAVMITNEELPKTAVSGAVPPTATAPISSTVPTSASQSQSQSQSQQQQQLEERTEHAEQAPLKSILIKNVASFDPEINPYARFTRQETMTSNGSLPFSQTASDRHTLRPTPLQQQQQQEQQQQQATSTPALKKALYTYHWDYVDPVLNMCSIVMVQNPMEGHHLISAVKHVLKQALYRDRISAPVMIRLLTAYCFVAELDFSLQLVNVFGEFLVDELKASILNNPKAHKYDLDGSEGHHHHHHASQREAEVGDESQKFHLGRIRKDSRTASLLREDKEKALGLSGGGETTLTGTAGVSLGLSGVVGGGGGGPRLAGGRTKFLASNFHLLHHLLIWDVDPSYNPEWTKIKWGILGSMRFPPGHPILLPGANDALRQETAAIIADWANV